MQRNFGLDRLKNSLSGRRSSEPFPFDLSILLSPSDRRDSSGTLSSLSGALKGSSKDESTSASRARALSLSVNSNMGGRSRSRSASVSKKQAKALIRRETTLIILKKLLSVLQDLGLLEPVPIETASKTLALGSKDVQIYLANSNECVFLPPVNSSSVAYDDEYENRTGNQSSNQSQRPEGHAEYEEPVFSDDDSTTSSMPGSRRTSSMNLDQMASLTTNDGVTLPAPLKSKIKNLKSTSFLSSKVEQSSPIPHTFAVIVELEKETSVKDVKVEFQSITTINWQAGDLYDRNNQKETFEIGKMKWNLELGDCDYYINLNNSSDVMMKPITPEILAAKTKRYVLGESGMPEKGEYFLHRSASSSSERLPHRDSGGSIELSKPGFYVFLLPVLIPPNIPATVNSLSGKLNHFLTVDVNKSTEKFGRRHHVSGEYCLPMVRTPPSYGLDLVDKPIYVDRVWNDSLSYIITFPKKFVSLGTEHLINVRLFPLVKDVLIKRIKFSVFERITYVSRDMIQEYDVDGNDPYMLSSDPKVRERTVPICELRTKQKASSNQTAEPYKEQVIKCPNNNLLFSCYEPEIDNFSLNTTREEQKDSVIATPLDISVALPFLTTKVDKAPIAEAEEAELTRAKSPFGSRKSSTASKRSNSVHRDGATSPLIGSIGTNIVHEHLDLNSETLTESEELLSTSTSFSGESSNNKECIPLGYTTLERALYPDSNYRHIQITHRLQICFRISKPDPKDNNRMHHYEVVVDTPLILLSAKCNPASTQIPSYDELQIITETNELASFSKNGVSISQAGEFQGEQLPSFEEATSGASSPVFSAVSLSDHQYSRLPSLAFPNEPSPSYEPASNPSSVFEESNIDELVSADTPIDDSRNRVSKLKSSLSSSFANISSAQRAASVSNGDQETSSLEASSTTHSTSSNAPSSVSLQKSNRSDYDIEPILDEEDPLHKPLKLNNKATEDAANSEASENESIPRSVVLSDETNDTSSTDSPITDNAEEVLNPNVNDSVSVFDSGALDQDFDLQSIFTVDTVAQFDQKLPLLDNYSVEDLIKTFPKSAGSGLKNASTDTLMGPRETVATDIVQSL